VVELEVVLLTIELDVIVDVIELVEVVEVVVVVERVVVVEEEEVGPLILEAASNPSTMPT